jgi:uncharacterized protein YjbJ (UPF0337 family)
MTEKAEDLKGRAKEAAGVLTDDDKLKREGQADRSAAAAKRKLHDVEQKVDEVIDRAKEKVLDAANEPHQT